MMSSVYSRSKAFLAPYVLICMLTLFLMTSCQSDVPLPTTSVSDLPTSETTAPVPSPEVTVIEPAVVATPFTPTPPPAIVSEIGTGDADDKDTVVDSKPEDSGEESNTSIPEGVFGPNGFPPDVNPLTGQTVGDVSLLERRPVAVKISNAPAIVRPQSGVNSADLVFEHYAEGGLTRFTAVFLGRDANPIGSIRSGRLIDIEIPQMYDAAFAYSGSSGPLQLMFRNGSFFERIISPDYGHGGFFRVEDPNKAFEHTLFTSSSNLRAILGERGENRAPNLSTNMAFSEAPLTEGETAGRVEIQYDGTYVTWVYNPATGRYTRWTDGAPHLDANTGEQLAFRNIVVVGAHHEDTDILEDNVAGGHYSIQIQIWGDGPVSMFRDGLRFDGIWKREDPSHMLTFYYPDGTVLPLAPGNSFFQMIPLGFDRLYVSP